MSRRPRNNHNTSCKCCGQSTFEYKHNLSKGLVRSLLKFAVLSKGQPTKLGQLTHTELANFQKLAYWGCAEPFGEKNSGYWVITPFGKSFINGHVKVHRAVWTWLGNPIQYDGDYVVISDILDGHEKEWQTYLEFIT